MEKSYELSPRAVRALNVMLEDYGFQIGERLLDDVLDVLSQLSHRSEAEQALQREILRMPREARQSLSRPIAAAMKK